MTDFVIESRRLTLREHFAGVAFNTLLDKQIHRSLHPKDIVRCVAMADVLIEALDLTPEQIKEKLRPKEIASE